MNESVSSGSASGRGHGRCKQSGDPAGAATSNLGDAGIARGRQPVESERVPVASIIRPCSRLPEKWPRPLEAHRGVHKSTKLKELKERLLENGMPTVKEALRQARISRASIGTLHTTSVSSRRFYVSAAQR